MIALRKSRERGYADHGWLRSHHSFSFAGYHDPRHMGFGNLRVINEDHIAPGTGFGAHGHKDMDSMGNEQTISPGEVQRMSAGSGVVHSEHNHAPGQNTHFLQIWLLPSETGMAPGYAQKAFADAEKRGRLRLVASPDGAESSVTVHADARLYAGLFDGNEHAELDLPAGRKTYVHLVRGALSVNGQRLTAGDAALVENEPQLCLENGVQSEVLVFDLQA
jgi:redox-sensitive bicupin YhaK (pirin superfamily)